MNDMVLTRPAPGAIEAVVAELAATFGNRLVTSQAVREQHGNTTTWIACAPPDAVVRQREEAVRIAAALAQLSAEQARLIRASYFDDMAHSAIAQALSLPLGTVKSRLRLAMARLRTLLADLP